MREGLHNNRAKVNIKWNSLLSSMTEFESKAHEKMKNESKEQIVKLNVGGSTF